MKIPMLLCLAACSHSREWTPQVPVDVSRLPTFDRVDCGAVLPQSILDHFFSGWSISAGIDNLCDVTLPDDSYLAVRYDCDKPFSDDDIAVNARSTPGLQPVAGIGRAAFEFEGGVEAYDVDSACRVTVTVPDGFREKRALVAALLEAVPPS